jgi:outer membrane murein-binding lipoprotein Lpp
MSDLEKAIDVNLILAGCIIGLLSWNIWTTQQLSIDVAVLTEKVQSLENKMEG